MNYDHKPGKRTLKNLKGVNAQLVALTIYAMRLSLFDFGVSEGKRSLARQTKLYSTGKSRTMKSKHLSGDAVDIYASGDNPYNSDRIYAITRAMIAGAKFLGIAHRIRWGGVWDRRVDQLNVENLSFEVEEYARRFEKAKGRRALIDKVHWEIR